MFRQFPFVDVAFGPGQVHKLAEFLTTDSLTAQGYFEFEGFTGHLPAQARARRSRRWVQISAGCNMKLLVLHRARPRAGARSRGRSTSSSPRSRALAADGVREVTLLGQNVNSYGARPAARSRAVRRAAARASTRSTGIDRIRYTSPHPPDMREDVDPRARRARVASASTSTCRCSRAPRAVLKAMRRTYDRERYLDRVALIREHVPGLRADDGHHRRLPGGDRGGLRARRSRSSRRSASTARSRSSTRRGAAPRRPSSSTTSSPHEVAGRAHGAARRGRPAARPRARPALRRPHARRARRGRVAHTTRRACAAARATTRSSTSTASPRRARSCRSRSPRATQPDARAARASRCARALTSECAVDAPLEPDVAHAPRSFRPPRCANICSCAGQSQTSKRTTPGRLPGDRATPSSRTLRRARGARHRASTRSAPSRRSTTCPARSRHAVRVDGQPVPRLHARLRVLLRPSDARVPGPERGAGLRARDRRQGQRARGAAGGARAAVVARRARRAGHEHRPVSVGREAATSSCAASGRRCATPRNPCSILTKSPLLLRDLDLLQGARAR